MVSLALLARGGVAAADQVDRDRFALHAAAELTHRWPRGEASASAVHARLDSVQRRLGALQTDASVRGADRHVSEVLAVQTRLIAAHRRLLAEVDRAVAATKRQRQRDGGKALIESFRLGADANRQLSDWGVEKGSSRTGGLVAGVLGGAVEADRLKRERTDAQQAAIHLAYDQFTLEAKQCVDLMHAHVDLYERDHGLKPGAFGLDSKELLTAEALRARPDDIFFAARYAATRMDDETPADIVRDAQRCAAAADTVPGSKCLAPFRADLRRMAVQTAAAALDRIDPVGLPAAAASITSPAQRIVAGYLATPGAESSLGYDAMIRVLAAQSEFSQAAGLLEKLDPQYCKDRPEVWYRAAMLYSLTDQPNESLRTLREAFGRGFGDVAHCKTCPELGNLRSARSDRFADLTMVKWKWRIQWGYRIAPDKIILTNLSAFPLSGIQLRTTIASTGYRDDVRVLTESRLRPGHQVTWTFKAGAIQSRGDDAKGRAMLTCDQ